MNKENKDKILEFIGWVFAFSAGGYCIYDTLKFLIKSFSQ